MTCIYTDGPEEKPNGRHVVELLRAADIPHFILCKMPDGTEVVVHRSKLKPIQAVEKQENPS